MAIQLPVGKVLTAIGVSLSFCIFGFLMILVLISASIQTKTKLALWSMRIPPGAGKVSIKCLRARRPLAIEVGPFYHIVKNSVTGVAHANVDFTISALVAFSA